MTNKTKNVWLVIGFIIALLLCFRFAISNTLEQKEAYTKLKKQELLFKNTPKQMSLLKQKQIYFDSILTKYQLDGSSIQNNLLKTLNTFSETSNIRVISFLEPHIISKNDLTIKTYEFVLEGTYNDILKLIHKLEQQTKYGEIISLHFEKKKNFRTGKYYLQTKVLLKSFG
ncbi:MAG: hypothetical protein ACK5M1_12780 [Xanthomarina gelatinilytica]|uniref:hypothetical protein n=1 Tax=Xanthomarina gelatinilytica TaxID=1137281 RepID=UPI003A83700A